MSWFANMDLPQPDVHDGKLEVVVDGLPLRVAAERLIVMGLH